jgi:hypothetical protein
LPHHGKHFEYQLLEQPELSHDEPLWSEQLLHSEVVQQSLVEQHPEAIRLVSAAAANLARRVCVRFMSVLFLSAHREKR